MFITKALARFSQLKKHTLPELSFGYGELEPVLSGFLLEFHHSKHHQAYVNNLNLALEQYQEAMAANNLQQMVKLNSAINFNYGGHYNHTFFWQNLTSQRNGGGQLPGESSALTKAVNQTWGSYEKLMADFNARTVAIQGSGWGWIGVDNTNKQLRYVNLPNQELPQSANITPILTVDVWEHAYWWDYKNVRPDFLKNVWQVINWSDVESKYLDAIKQ